VLGWLAQSELAVWRHSTPDLMLLALAMLGVFIVLLPKGVPHRWMGVLFLLPALLVQPPRPDKAAFWVTVLDVGQGLSVFVQTQRHALLFDAGARLGDDFDLGERVVVPFLRHQQIHHLDTLMISHGDNDHKGGAQAVIDAIEVAQVLGQDIGDLEHSNKRLCQRDQRWQWDGVDFVVLHPDTEYRKTNNRACVLRVSNQQHSLLIASDIERKVEKHLLASHAANLNSDVLLVPHHGSKTSSSEAWVSAVSPSHALVSSGFANRFGHPEASVVERYRLHDSILMNTAEAGAISVYFEATQAPLRITSHRFQVARYWHHLPLR
jgi:competence protein ComEC